MNTANPYAPPQANVSDVPSEPVELDLAGRGVRLGAWLLDYVITNAFVYVPMFAGMAITGFNAQEPSPLAMVFPLIGWIAWAIVTAMLVAKNGQSIAKKLLNIKVVRTDGGKASLGRIFWLRNFVPALLVITIIFPLIDVLFIFGEEKQCLHDKIADTIVVIA